MRIIATIDGEQILENPYDGKITFKAKAAVDTDGSGPLHGDPCAQRDTSLHWRGKALNADEDRYIVVPPAIIQGVKGIVLGCQAHAKNIKNGHETEAVVGDVGPHKKIGEVSVATAKALGINPSPTSGGVDEHIIEYTIRPGVAATVNGKAYTLQPYRK
jgi:hypothetical protein